MVKRISLENDHAILHGKRLFARLSNRDLILTVCYFSVFRLVETSFRKDLYHDVKLHFIQDLVWVHKKVLVINIVIRMIFYRIVYSLIHQSENNPMMKIAITEHHRFHQHLHLLYCHLCIKNLPYQIIFHPMSK